MTTDLSIKMHALANSGHDKAALLREYADKFDMATNGYLAQEQTVTVKQYLATWARARKLYCECSGEDLV